MIIKKEELRVQVHVLELEIRFRPVRFTLNTTLTQMWWRPVACIDVDVADRSWNARVLRRWLDLRTFTSGCVFFSLFIFLFFFFTLGTWVSRNVAAQVFQQLELFFKEMLEYTRGGAWLSMFLSRAVACWGCALSVSWGLSLRCCCVLSMCASVCFAGGCCASVFQQWYTATMNLLGTWLTERMDQQLHVYQLKILIRITKVTQPWSRSGIPCPHARTVMVMMVTITERDVWLYFSL